LGAERSGWKRVECARKRVGWVCVEACGREPVGGSVCAERVWKRVQGVWKPGSTCVRRLAEMGGERGDGGVWMRKREREGEREWEREQEKSG